MGPLKSTFPLLVSGGQHFLAVNPLELELALVIRETDGGVAKIDLGRLGRVVVVS